MIWQVFTILCYKILGRASCNRSSDDETHASGELKPLVEKNDQYKLDPIREGTDLIYA